MGLDLTSGRIPAKASPEEARAAAVYVAGRVAAEHPHELDALMPRLAGRQLAADPAVAAGLRELFAALGLLPDGSRP